MKFAINEICNDIPIIRGSPASSPVVPRHDVDHGSQAERLQRMGVLGCVLCIVGSTVIVLHAPEEHTPSSVQEIWNLAIQPVINWRERDFMLYVWDIGKKALSFPTDVQVMSIKAIGIAIKLTIEGINQAGYFQTWVFAMVAITYLYSPLSPKISWHYQGNREAEKKHKDDDLVAPEFVAIIRQDYFT
ncbi:hypothetical protein QJS10_CPA02g00588 [Acorus calamus]|uniref:Probable magnesium transporter n=1 Tax=Acorus calamus TaxID=4465 RepID=A0AAV9FBK5_ACOCL|nr:hypothetical protein QJS10_CPA02g00588 [Acorus calamus]